MDDERSDEAPSVAVIGNGATGTLAVASLLREATRAHRALRIEWIGDGPTGRGVAYATTRPWHRLNVPAPKMTLGEAAQDFPGWRASRGGDDDAFAPRHEFGTYLLETLDAARGDAAESVELREHHDRAVGVAGGGAGVRVDLRVGAPIDVDRVVLALGPFPGAGLPGADDVRSHPRLVEDPWDGRLEQIREGDAVLLVGTGLTMVDVALSIARHAPGVSMRAVSRTGLVPRSHLRDEGEPAEPVVRPDPGLTLDGLVDGVETGIDAQDGRWREVVDGLRPVTPELWKSLSWSDQRRFLQEHARRWEVHRHRMAPSVAEELDGLRHTGALTIGTAGVRGVEAVGDRLRVHLGTADDNGEPVDVDWVVSCTGSQDDVTAVDDPLVRSLLRGGHARPHPLGLGFDTHDGGAMDTEHGTSDRFFALATLRRGELYETTAIPEIRDQAADLSRRLLDDGSRRRANHTEAP